MSSNSVQTLNGLFKERYADQVKDLVPDHIKLYNAIKFDSAKKQGASYNEPVILSLESGFTYGGEAGEAFTLNVAKEFKMKNASIKAREIVLRSAISIAALNRSQSDDQAINKSMDLMVANMLKSMYHRLEVQMFYGQSGIGEVLGSIVDAAGSPSTANGSSVPVKSSEWAAGIWNGTTNAEIEIFSNDLATKRGIYRIDGYSLKNRSVALTQVDSLGSPTADLSTIVDTDVIYFKGACVAGPSASRNEFLGIHQIASETSSLFGIPNATEPLFQGSIQDVGTEGTPTVLSQEKVEEGIALMVEKGLMEEQVTVYVNPKQWTNLLSEQTAKRTVDQTYSEDLYKAGSREIEFFGQNGTIKIVATTFVKEGYAYIVSEKDLKRIGSVEVTFKRPDGEDFFKLLENVHGVEMRCMTDQALFTARPSAICILRYINPEA